MISRRGETAIGDRIDLWKASIETIIEAQVIEALRTCFDPEIPVNIYEMGLIYDVKVDAAGVVDDSR